MRYCVAFDAGETGHFTDAQWTLVQVLANFRLKNRTKKHSNPQFVMGSINNNSFGTIEAFIEVLMFFLLIIKIFDDQHI